MNSKKDGVTITADAPPQMLSIAACRNPTTLLIKSRRSHLSFIKVSCKPGPGCWPAITVSQATAHLEGRGARRTAIARRR